MIVDLNNTSEYDKQIIYLDSRNGIFTNENDFSFNIKFDDKLKNLTSVKIIESTLLLNGKLGLKWEYIGIVKPGNTYTNITSINALLKGVIDYKNTEFTMSQYTTYNIAAQTELNYIELEYGMSWSNAGFTIPASTTSVVNTKLQNYILEKYCVNETIINFTRHEYNDIFGVNVIDNTKHVKIISGLLWEKTSNPGLSTLLLKELDENSTLAKVFINSTNQTNIEITKTELRDITSSTLIDGNYIKILTNYYQVKPVYFIPEKQYFKPVKRVTYNNIYYIELNNFYRIFSYINKKNKCDNTYTNNTIKYFDSLNYNGSIDSNLELYKFRNYYSLISADWTDPALYILNPPETSCNRFTITIRDKDFNIIKYDPNGESFNMTICVYTIKKNIYG
jgi:hypothetical protein